VAGRTVAHPSVATTWATSCAPVVPLDPRRAGLPDNGRLRRVPGLRREELSQLANVSVDYIGRLKQGRTRRVSPGARRPRPSPTTTVACSPSSSGSNNQA